MTFATKNILSVLEIQNVSLHFTFNLHKIKISKQCASATEVLFGYACVYTLPEWNEGEEVVINHFLRGNKP